MKTTSPRVLVIAEAANPEWTSVPLVGWSLAFALRDVAKTHLVTQVRNAEAILRHGVLTRDEFTAIDSETVARPLHRLSRLLTGGSGTGWTTRTAIATLSYYYFEHLVWSQFGKAICNGDFDIVHRVTPLSPTTPSLLARKCQRAGVPFVLGPLNGGVPWPRPFDSARRQEREWLSYVRSAYKLLPGYRSTLQSASAILAGSRYTLSQIPNELHTKCIFLPENAIDPTKFSKQAARFERLPMRACFVGRLVPYKGPDMLLEAVAPMIRGGQLQLDIIGDGPLMPKLRQLAAELELGNGATIHGWIDHSKLQDLMCLSQVFAFPSIREFGGGAVLEAMALGLVPVIVDYAGPTELVTDGTGFKVPVGTRDEIVRSIRLTMAHILEHPDEIAVKGRRARERVLDEFTWQAKATQVAKVYAWVLGNSETPPHLDL